MRSQNKIYPILCLFLLMLISCKKNNKEYEILNDFIKSNNIKITHLQNNPFCYKDLHLTSSEEKALNINLKNDIFCNTPLEIDRINDIGFQKNKFKSQISFPIFSNDMKYVYIIVSQYDSNEINFFRSTVLYKLEKINNHWKIIDKFGTITQT